MYIEYIIYISAIYVLLNVTYFKRLTGIFFHNTAVKTILDSAMAPIVSSRSAASNHCSITLSTCHLWDTVTDTPRCWRCCRPCLCVTAWPCAPTRTSSVTACSPTETCFCRAGWSTRSQGRAAVALLCGGFIYFQVESENKPLERQHLVFKGVLRHRTFRQC